MYNFDYLTKICEIENNSKGKQNEKYTMLVLNKVVDYINKEYEKNKTVPQINKEINNVLHNYLTKISQSEIKTNVIFHYVKNNMYSKQCNIRDIYKRVLENHEKGIININKMDIQNESYSYNVNRTVELAVILAIQNVRKEKQELKKNEEITYILNCIANMKSSKERELFLKKCIEDKEAIQFIKQAYSLFKKSEVEIVEETVKGYFEKNGTELKDNCITYIRESLKILEEFDLLKDYIDFNNKSYKKISVNNVNYTYEQVLDFYKEENLRKLNVDNLIVLSSFWINRVNKVMIQINESMYILKEMSKMSDEQDDKKAPTINEKYIKNIQLKMNLLHKLCFDVFKYIDTLYEKDGRKIDITENIDHLNKIHGEKYKNYFDKLFPNSENDLKKDVFDVLVYENIRYNSYEAKSENMQALLMCLLNSESKNIENFGYIKEPKDDKYILIGADMKGFNMPFTLHIDRDLVLDFLNEAQDNTKFPIYKGSEDFIIGQNEVLKAQIYVPCSKDYEKVISEATTRITPNDRYGNLIKHLNYLTSNGKIPAHICEVKKGKNGKDKCKYIREYVELDNRKIDIEDER